MQLNEITYADNPPVEGYGPGFFRVAGRVIDGGCLLLPGQQGPWGGYDDLAAILQAAPEVDVLFLGTGATLEYLPEATQATLEGAGIGVELMASPQACRTYNVLLSEGRRVALAALPVENT